jgi:hypothetical protein
MAKASHYADQRIRSGEEELAENQRSRLAVELKVVPFDHGPDGASNHGATKLRAMIRCRSGALPTPPGPHKLGYSSERVGHDTVPGIRSSSSSSTSVRFNRGLRRRRLLRRCWSGRNYGDGQCSTSMWQYFQRHAHPFKVKRGGWRYYLISIYIVSTKHKGEVYLIAGLA